MIELISWLCLEKTFNKYDITLFGKSNFSYPQFLWITLCINIFFERLTYKFISIFLRLPNNLTH